MWKCPKCETLNETDICVICGEQKPIYDESEAFFYDDYGMPEEDLEKRPKNWIFYLVAAVSIIAIIAGMIPLGAGRTDEDYAFSEETEAKEIYWSCESAIEGFFDGGSDLFIGYKREYLENMQDIYLGDYYEIEGIWYPEETEEYEDDYSIPYYVEEVAKVETEHLEFTLVKADDSWRIIDVAKYE